MPLRQRWRCSGPWRTTLEPTPSSSPHSIRISAASCTAGQKSRAERPLSGVPRQRMHPRPRGDHQRASMHRAVRGMRISVRERQSGVTSARVVHAPLLSPALSGWITALFVVTRNSTPRGGSGPRATTASWERPSLTVSPEVLLAAGRGRISAAALEHGLERSGGLYGGTSN